ncbi:CCR4-NOT transcription complex subunit 1 [Coccomyxa sp. Obi]|nr:CCR4-NOT transcription complex subunit 1 [Coccomyxa sp. Obi]
MATDALARLIVTLVIAHNGGLDLLSKVLGVVAGCLQREAAARAEAFNGRPYFRILLGLICELAPAEPGAPEELPAMKMLAAIAVTLEGVQPVKVPGFAFQWLELISHRHLMPKLVLAPGQAGWPHLERLLVALLRFLEPYLRNADLTDAIRNLYKGTLRVLLVLLHDFPEFLCEYHFELCNVVPPSCIQMRNLILSAFPRNMRLPDPFTPNLKVDLLSEITIAPSYRPEAAALLPAGLRAEVDAYMAARQPASFLATLKQRLLLPQHETLLCGTKYSQPLLNALVFYVGIRATEALKGAQPVMHAPAVDVFQRLANDLDTEGRYLFLNALANQLRFPNSHTHYFSCVLLFLFSEAQQEIVQEQITRVLLERLIVNRPHPWGLLITFIELIKNPRYNFWSLSFTHCDAEIERLFESVAQSCMGPHKAAEQQQQGGTGGGPGQGQPQLQSVGA